MAVDGRFSQRGDLLFWNDGGGAFREGAVDAGISGDRRSLCAVAADYDNDGNLDIFVADQSGKNVLYRNDGDGTFTDMSEAIDLGEDSDGAAWGDFDNDGFVDLFVVNSAREPNALYRNVNGSAFEDVSASAGVNDPYAAFGAAWADYDNDGDLDIYVSGEGPNRLYRNNGDGTFTDVAEESGVSDNGVGRGIAWADYDNDGDLDLYVGNLKAPNVLYRNEGDGSFKDVTAAAGVEDKEWTEGVSWADFDNDGWADLYIARIGGRGKGGAMNRLFKNLGDGTFEDVSESAGVAGGVTLSYACPWADIDKDGDLDLYVSGGKKSREGRVEVHLYRNGGTDNHWLGVRLSGDRSNRLGIGAVVKLHTAVGIQTAQVTGGSGFNSQGSVSLHFGLGNEGSASVDVTWPDGTVQKAGEVSADQEVVIRESASAER